MVVFSDLMIALLYTERADQTSSVSKITLNTLYRS